MIADPPTITIARGKTVTVEVDAADAMLVGSMLGLLHLARPDQRPEPRTTEASDRVGKLLRDAARATIAVVR